MADAEDTGTSEPQSLSPWSWLVYIIYLSEVGNLFKISKEREGEEMFFLLFVPMTNRKVSP